MTGHLPVYKALYYATDPYLGVRPSFTYHFLIITGPVGAYYKEGLNPVKIYVEQIMSVLLAGGHRRSKDCRQLRSQPEGSAGCQGKGIHPGIVA
jgi:hypothetical protein